MKEREREKEINYQELDLSLLRRNNLIYRRFFWKMEISNVDSKNSFLTFAQIPK